jgi:hypothetical protein
MALSVSVAKKDVVTTQDKLYTITLEVVLSDTGGAGFIRQYSCDYRTGESIASKKQGLINTIQVDIDMYKAAEALSKNAALATAISEIQSGLVL